MGENRLRAGDGSEGAGGRPCGVPWQVWVATILLGLEGIGNLLSIPQQPTAATWLAAKCLFIVGLLRGWSWVFVLFLVVAGSHVLAFGTRAPFIASLNLVVLLLVGSAWRRFLPVGGHREQGIGAKSPALGTSDRGLDA